MIAARILELPSSDTGLSIWLLNSTYSFVLQYLLMAHQVRSIGL